jgi:repressor LexA
MKAIGRLYQYFDLKSIKPTRFEKEFGLSNGYFGIQRKRDADIGSSILEIVIDNCRDLNIDWLISGNGEMLRSDKKHEEQKESKSTEGILTAASIMSGRDNYRHIPFVAVTAVAGFGNGVFSIENTDVKGWYVIPLFEGRKIDFMIEVSGASMYPKYNNGDVVACTILRENRFIQWNKVHVIGTIEQGILIKRVKKGPDENHLLLVSDNKDYEPFVVSQEDVTGMALVVGVIRLE